MTIIYDKISEQEFNEFLNVLKELDPIEYQNESVDNFYSLYLYWNNVSSKRRFYEKLENNKTKLQQKTQ